MPLLWVSLVVSLETRAASFEKSGLATAALQSPRPRACGAGTSGENELWSRARAGDAERFCELIARGYARLNETPREAAQAAEAAEAIVGATPEVAILKARALARSGEAASALEQFQRAEQKSSLTLLDPEALHDYARVTSVAGKPADAVRLYRALVSRSALVADARERTVLALEAAAHVLAYAPNGSDEALGYLAQARRAGFGLSPFITGLRALIAERNGASVRTPATSSLPSVAALGQAVTGRGDATLTLPPGELDAVRAVLAEASDKAASRAAWQAFFEHAKPENVWLAQTRKKHAEPAPRKADAR